MQICVARTVSQSAEAPEPVLQYAIDSPIVPAMNCEATGKGLLKLRRKGRISGQLTGRSVEKSGQKQSG
jgi:hypothetical protein